MAANDVQVDGNHYKQFTIQPWDAIEDWGLGFTDGCAIKYIARWRYKGQRIKDLEKAAHCIEKLLELERKKQ